MTEYEYEYESRRAPCSAQPGDLGARSVAVRCDHLRAADECSDCSYSYSYSYSVYSSSWFSPLAAAPATPDRPRTAAAGTTPPIDPPDRSTRRAARAPTHPVVRSAPE